MTGRLREANAVRRLRLALTVPAELDGGPVTAGRSLAMLPNSLALIASKVATLGLGYLFWLVVAREFPTEQVGLAAAVVSASLLCVQLALLGVGSAVITLFPRHRLAPGRLVDASLTLAALGGLVVGALFVLVLAAVSNQLDVLATRPGYTVLFTAMSVAGTVGVLLDQLSTALRRGDQALTRGALNGVLSLALVAALALLPHRPGSMAIFACWVLGAGAACVLGAQQLWRVLDAYRFRVSLERSLTRRLVRVGLPNHALTLADRAPGLLLPVLVTELVSPQDNAYWYAAWMMAWVVFFIPVQVGMTLFAEISHGPAAVERLVRSGLRSALGLGLPAAAITAALATFALAPLGERYADAGATPLRILVLGVVPLAFLQAYYALCRASGRLREATATAVVAGLVSVAVAAVAAVAGGLTAMAVGWVLAQSVAGVWAAWRLYRLRGPGGRVAGAWPWGPRHAAVRAGAAPPARDTSAAAPAARPSPRCVRAPPAADALGIPAGMRVMSGAALTRRVPALWMAVRRHDAGVTAATGTLGPPAAERTPASGAALATARRPRPLRVRRRPRPRVGEPPPSAVAVAALAGALALWIAGAPSVRLRDMTSIGLLSVLPASSLVALALVCVSFALTIRRPAAPPALLVLHLVVLVFMLYGAGSLVEPEPRFAETWRHVGLIAAIGSGHLDPTIDAYFNWPGFFILGAMLTSAAGLDSPLAAAAWAPVGYELLYLGPLLMIMRALTPSRRLVWLGVWAFYLCNWIGQDYFSPQGFAYLLYLVVLAVVLTWLRVDPARRPPWVVPSRVVPAAEVSAGTRAGLVAIVVLVFAATVPSHQLTPFAILLAVAAVIVLGRCRATGLPVVMAVMLGAWISFMTVGYLSGHLHDLLSNVGAIGSTLSSSSGERVRGDLGHRVVAGARLAETAVLWALAAFAFVRRARRGRDDVIPMVLLVTPILLIGVQSYGGEILLRVVLFSLPFTAFLVASLAQHAPAVVLATVSIALAGTFLLTYYGNERVNWYSHDEVAAVNELTRVAPHGSTLVAWTSTLPWQGRDYARHRYRLMIRAPSWPRIAALPPGGRRQLALVAEFLRSQPGGAYLVLTRSQKAAVDLNGFGPRGSLERVDAALRRSARFRLLYANRDGSVFTTAPVRVPR